MRSEKNCTECGELTTTDRWGTLIHDGRVRDSHAPVLEAS
jgi:hypothetical protein